VVTLGTKALLTPDRFVPSGVTIVSRNDQISATRSTNSAGMLSRTSFSCSQVLSA